MEGSSKIALPPAPDCDVRRQQRGLGLLADGQVPLPCLLLRLFVPLFPCLLVRFVFLLIFSRLFNFFVGLVSRQRTSVPIVRGVPQPRP